jgi:hypothetical protein
LWQTITVPFDRFASHGVAVALDVGRLRRLALVGTGLAFHADLAIGGAALYGL